MRKLLFLCLFMISNIALAQDNPSLSITESEAYRDKVKSYNVIAIHTSEVGETVIVRQAYRDFLFDVFDTNLKKIDNKIVEKKKKERHVGSLFYNNQLKFFTVQKPKKDKRILSSHTIDLATKKYNKKIIFETTVEKKQNLFGSKNKHNTNFAISPNGAYFAIATDNVNRYMNSYTIRVFDANTEALVYKKSYQENEKQKYRHNDLYIDNDASVYSLGKIYIEEKASKKENGDANYQFVLNKITKDKISELLLNLENLHINSLRLAQVNGDFHLFGFYSELNAGRISGGCDFIIDTAQFNLSSKKVHELPNEIYEGLYPNTPAEQLSEKHKELRSFRVNHVLSDYSENTYMIAEKYYVTSMHVSGGATTPGGYPVYTDHYNDIIILKFNKNGDLGWGRSIYKRDNGPSYNAFIKNNKLHVILNSGTNLNDVNNEGSQATRKLFESSALYDFEYSETGDVSLNKLQENKNNQYYSPYYGTYNDGKFIMMSSGGKKKTFMTIE